MNENMLEKHLNSFLENRTVRNYQMVVATMLSAESGCENVFVTINGHNADLVSVKSMEKDGLRVIPVFTAREQAEVKVDVVLHEVNLINFLNEEMKMGATDGIVINCWDRGGCVIQNDYIIKMNQFLSQQQ